VGGDFDVSGFERKAEEGLPQNLRLMFSQSDGPALRRESAPKRLRCIADGHGQGSGPRAPGCRGKSFSYNNIVDLQAAWDLAQEFDEPVCAIIKHTNPCGTATGALLAEAYLRRRMRSGVCVWRGDWRESDHYAPAATEMVKLFLEVIAVRHLTKTQNRFLQPRKTSASSKFLPAS